MDIQLQELIDQIKKNGVKAAEDEAAEILKSAKAEAGRIISDAKSEADKLIKDAKDQNDRYARVSEDSIRQAGRNLLISFRESVTRELDAIIADNVAQVFSSDKAVGLIANVVESYSKNGEDISLLLNTDDLNKLEKSLLIALSEKLLGGVTLKPNDNFNGGFRISVNNGRAYYDYSSDEITDMLSAYLNPKVTALMKEAEV